MRIGVVTTSYPRWPGDAAGSFVAGHVDALRAKGHEVEVLAAAAGNPLFYTGGAPDVLERSPRHFATAAAFTVKLAARLATRRHDAIVAHWLAPSAIAALPARAPLLAIAHGGDIHTLRRLNLLGPVLRLLRRRGARLAFVSSELRALAHAALPGDYIAGSLVQPMGIDLARFARIARAESAEHDRPMVLVVARLVPVKGVDLMLAALAHLRTRVRLVIAGDGPERARLAHPDATFVGEVDAETRDRLLGQARLVVIPSRTLANGRSEGTPLIALEALAAGVPVVASAVGGLSELPVRLATPTPIGLATAIDDALRSPPSVATLRASVAHLDWSQVADRLMGEKPVTPALRHSA